MRLPGNIRRVISLRRAPPRPEEPRTRRRSRAAAAACLLLAPATLFAQWLDYPTPGVPRDANGKPNLSAPAPRSGGHVDLTGIWGAADTLTDDCPPPAPGVSEDQACIRQQGLPRDQINIGRSLKDGLPYQPWAAELVKKRTANQAIEDPHAHCLPPIFPRAYVLPQYFKLVQTPGLTVLLHEFNATYRQIFTDGRPLPKQMNPTWNGYSTGHWEGDTLVVETAGFRDDLWLDFSGSPLTEAARVTERFKRPNFGTLEIEVTVNDPKAYTRPWTVTLAEKLIVDTDLLDEVCLENEQDTRLTDAK